MSSIKAKYGRRHLRSAERNHEIDLVLAVMCCLLQPGQRISRNVIAELTGLSHGGPFMIEQRALRKLRTRLRYHGTTGERGFGKEMAA